ncbi:hypothetical protein HYDPIDRAFT_110841 [Hydnomerulius pinastri MD-312]|nr:hypothetical protein HYDPIDRAFT_110841 [Hydnomerulius pinastri MD-312]
MSSEEPQPSPQDTIKPKDYHAKFTARKSYSQYTDPCEDASKASLTCMDRNEYNRDKCMEYFEAYRECKKTWLAQRRSDRQRGRPTPT